MKNNVMQGVKRVLQGLLLVAVAIQAVATFVQCVGGVSRLIENKEQTS